MRAAAYPHRYAGNGIVGSAHQMTRLCFAILFFLSFVQMGCITSRTIERAKPHNCQYARITRVTKAAVTSTDLFVEFQVRPMGGEIDEPRVLRIPLDTSDWLHDKRGKPVVLSEGRVDETQVHHVSDWFLLPQSAIPAEAAEVPVSRVQIEDLRKLPEKAARVDGNVQVLSVDRGIGIDQTALDTGETSSTFSTMSDPLIAILSRPDSKAWKTALIIANVCAGCEQNRGWYVLTPLAVAGDAVTFPFQAIAILLMYVFSP